MTQSEFSEEARAIEAIGAIDLKSTPRADEVIEPVLAEALPSFAQLGPGGQLRQARKACGMTLADVGDSLKMSPRQIEAVENEDYSRLSSATFIRGFIRNYAKLLKIDATPLLSALDAKLLPPVAELSASSGSGVRMPVDGEREGKKSLAAIVVAVVLLGVALLLYFDVVDLSKLLQEKTDTAKPAAITTPSNTTLTSPTEPTTAASAQTDVAAPNFTVLATESTSAVPPAVSPVLPLGSNGSTPIATAELTAKQITPLPLVLKPGERQLVFSFDADAWVEAKDANGRMLLSQLSLKGTTQTVGGKPPFQLVVGNAANVRLQSGDHMVDLKPHIRAEVARLSLD